MAESREIVSPAKEVAPIVSPVEQLVQQSTVSYSPPPELASSGAGTTAGKIILASTPVSVSEKPAGTSTPISTTATVQPQTLFTRPLLIGNLMIDPVTGTSTVLTTPSAGSGGGGGGGGSSATKSGTAAVQKKSWVPVILIGIGAVFILSKFVGKKAKA